MDIREFKESSNEVQKKMLKSLVIEHQCVEIKHLEKHGISKYDIMRLFGNMANLLIACGVQPRSRKHHMTEDEFKDYIKNIAIIDSLTGCWTTEKYAYQEKTKRTKITFKGKTTLLYRVAYFLFKGPLDANLVVMHECDNESCFNPEHLVQGTPKQNSIDREKRKRSTVTRKESVYPRHKLNGPYDPTLLALVLSRCSVSEKNEWLYNGHIAPNGYAVIKIKGKNYGLHRLMLANALGVKYEEVNLACHKFPENSKYAGDTPRRHDVNPAHLYDGTNSQNAKDAALYHKGTKLFLPKVELIKAKAKMVNFSDEEVSKRFDLEMAREFDVGRSTIQKIRLDLGLGKGNKKRAILQFFKGEKIQEFASAADAARTLGLNSISILRVCHGERKSYKGFQWVFKRSL